MGKNNKKPNTNSMDLMHLNDDKRAGEGSPEEILLRIIDGWNETAEGDSLTTPEELSEGLKETSLWRVYEALQKIPFRLFKAENALNGVFHAQFSPSSSLTQKLFDKVEEVNLTTSTTSQASYLARTFSSADALTLRLTRTPPLLFTLGFRP